MVGVSVPQTEAQFQRAVVEYARLRGWLVYHTYDSRRSQGGFPDLVMVRVGAQAPMVVFAELKAEKGKLSREQDLWLGKLWHCETERMLVRVWRPSDWPEIEEVLK